MRAFTHGAGEPSLHKEVSQTLLPVLVRRQSPCHYLISMPVWRDLFNLFSAPPEHPEQSPFRSVDTTSQRAVAVALCKSVGASACY